MKKFFLILASVLVMLSSMLSLTQAAATTTPTNLIANPSVETADSSNSAVPAGWLEGNWGTNSTTFSYLNTGHTGTRSVEVQMTSYTSGDAKWYFTPVAITSGGQYAFSDYYESTVATELVAQFDDGNGNYTYQDLGAEAASAGWAEATATFTAPSTAKNVTVFHLLGSVGSLTTDDFSLTAQAAATAPTVSISSPAASASVSGTTTLSATAADTSGNGSIASVQFQLDGANLGSPVTTTPYQYSWNTLAATNGAHSLTAVATDTNGLNTTSAALTITVNNPVAIGTNLIANSSVETASPTSPTTPEYWQTGGWGTNTTAFSYLKTGHTGTHSVEVQMTSYTSGDAKWIFNPVSVTGGLTYTFSDYYESNVATEVDVAFTMSDGSTQYLYLGAPAASTSWKQFSANFVAPTGATSATVYHLIESVGSLTTDDYSLAASSLPSVTLTAPTGGQDVTGTQTITATATDNTGIKSVQFQLDGVNLGSPVTAAPYQYTWNSTTTANGTHTLTAIATDTNGKTATSAAVSVDVNNAATSGGNLVPNPLVQTANPANAKLPENWSTDTWGTNTTTFTYQTSGYSGSKALNVKTTAYTSGDSKWAFDAIPVTVDQQYKFSEYYESNVQTEVEAVFNMSDGSIIYDIIGQPEPATTWTNFTTEFAVPEGAQTMTIYHLIQSVGSLTTSNFSLTPYTPVGFNRPLVTLTFDDGYVNQYTETLPLLEQYGFTSTQFIITDLLGQTGYLTNAEVEDLYTSGNEIASHTVTHDDLTQETAKQLKTEMSGSQSTLESITGHPVTDIAYPYGLYNTSVISAAKADYTAARGVEDGYNSKDNFNVYDLKVQNVYNTTTTAQIADWVAQAQATNTWLILVYHSVDPDVNSTIDGGIYNVTPDQLNDQLAAIKASGVTVETMQQALAELTPQVSQ